MRIRSTRKRKNRADRTTPRRRRRRLGEGARPKDHHFSSPGEPRDWAALHHDLLYKIFSRIPQADILRGAGLACAAWRRLAVDEPLLWRRIDLADDDNEGCRSDEDGRPEGWKQMARAAVHRSTGRCESFRGRLDCGFLLYLAYSAPSLRSLHVTSRLDIRDERLARRVMRKLPLLEQLVLSSGRIGNAALVAIAGNCPSLELFDASGCRRRRRICRNLERRFPSTIKVLRLPQQTGYVLSIRQC